MKSSKDFINGNWRPCVLLMGHRRPRRRWTMHQRSPMVNRPTASLPLALSRQSDSIFSVSVVVTFHVYKCFSLARWSVSLSRILQLPEKCRHPRSCASPSLTCPSVSLSPSQLCLFLPSWPTDQQTAAHASVVDTILEHWLSDRSTPSFSQYSSGYSGYIGGSRIWYINEIPFHCLIWFL